MLDLYKSENPMAGRGHLPLLEVGSVLQQEEAGSGLLPHDGQVEQPHGPLPRPSPSSFTLIHSCQEISEKQKMERKMDCTSCISDQMSLKISECKISV